MQRAETEARGGDGNLEEREEEKVKAEEAGEVRIASVSMPPSAWYWLCVELQSCVGSQLSLRRPYRPPISSVVSKWKTIAPSVTLFFLYFCKIMKMNKVKKKKTNIY